MLSSRNAAKKRKIGNSKDTINTTSTKVGLPVHTQSNEASTTTSATSNPADRTRMGIELLDSFQNMCESWPKDMARLLDPSLPDDRRDELWNVMCEGGDTLRQRFAWAIPNERALRILEHFGPVVEIGSGLGYWAMLLRSRGVDINAYDKYDGAPSKGETSAEKRAEEEKDAKEGGAKADEGAATLVEENEAPSFWTKVEAGGPEVLEEPCNEKRSLFLCYPDDFEGETESLGLRCLHAFEGDVVIHVGEVFGDSVSMTLGQTPWGRTTSRECQEELASKFHCILKVPLPHWPHSRDTLTVWKRHTFCTIQYGDSDDEEDGKEGKEHNDNDEGRVQGEQHEKEYSDSMPSASGSPSTAENSSNGGVVLRRPRERGVAGKKKEGGHRDDGGSGDSGSDFDSEGSVEGLPMGLPGKPGDSLSDSDDEGFLTGMTDLDMFASVPADEEMPCVQAAPCVRFLLDAP